MRLTLAALLMLAAAPALAQDGPPPITAPFSIHAIA